MTVTSFASEATLGAVLRASRHPGEPTAAALGTLLYAGPAGDVPCPLLQPDAVHDAWYVDAPVQRGRQGRLQWARAGHWCWGQIDDEAWDPRSATPPERLAEAAEALYRELLDFLQAGDTPHLLRLWNYLPLIGREDGGLERYRHFNIGRQRGLMAADRSAFEGAPAACALGCYEGPLKLRFLAGRAAPLAIENPRQVSAYRYPPDYGPASPSFSRAALCDAGGGQLALLVSGTASIVGHATLHAGDWRAQLDETLRNLDAVFASARARCSADFQLANSHCVVYLREPALAADVREAFAQAVGVDSIAARTAVLLQADICRSDLLLEIEAHALADGSRGPLSPLPSPGTP